MPTSQQDALAAMEPHEAVAVLFRLHGDLVTAAEQVAERADRLGEHLDTVLTVVGKEHVAKAANLFVLDDHPDAEAYLDELVARVTA